MPKTVTCPECRTRFSVVDDARPGDEVDCAKCGHEFVLKAAGRRGDDGRDDEEGGGNAGKIILGFIAVLMLLGLGGVLVYRNYFQGDDSERRGRDDGTPRKTPPEGPGFDRRSPFFGPEYVIETVPYEEITGRPAKQGGAPAGKGPPARAKKKAPKPPPRDGIMPAAVREKIKAAAVYIKTAYPTGAGTGSGFLVWRDGGEGVITTNHHVVFPQEGPPDREPGKVAAVFFSGRDGEYALEAEVVAADEGRDLAFLRVKKKDGDLPEPMDVNELTPVTETMRVYTVGFPLGGRLAAERANPAVNLSTSTVSSLRQARDGQLATVQVEGSIEPGNSGGPVVDALGRLVGVAVRKLIGKSIGFAIPAWQVRDSLRGSVSGPTLAATSAPNGHARLEMRLSIMDPLKRLRGAEFVVVPAEKVAGPPKPGPDGEWAPLAGGRALRSVRRGRVAAASLPLPLKQRKSGAFVVQTVTRRGGKNIYSRPTDPIRIAYQGPQGDEEGQADTWDVKVDKARGIALRRAGSDLAAVDFAVSLADQAEPPDAVQFLVVGEAEYEKSAQGDKSLPTSAVQGAGFFRTTKFIAGRVHLPAPPAGEASYYLQLAARDEDGEWSFAEPFGPVKVRFPQ